MRATSFIDTLFDSKLVMGIACAGAMAAGVMAVVLWQRPVEAPVAAAEPTGSWNDPIGPGLLARPGQGTQAFGAQVPRDANIAVDANGHLVPDRTLRSLMDGFLVTPKPSERQAMEVQLRELLAVRLRQPAAGEADRLVTAYAAYLQAEAQARARERFSQADPDGLSDQQVQHLLAWQRERTGLRERMLGNEVVNAWFAEEDGNCTAVLIDWEKQLAPPDQNDSNEQMDRRRWGDTLAQRRNTNAQACAAQIAESIAPRG